MALIGKIIAWILRNILTIAAITVIAAIVRRFRRIQVMIFPMSSMMMCSSGGGMRLRLCQPGRAGTCQSLFQKGLRTVQVGEKPGADGCGMTPELVLMRQCPFHGFGQARQVEGVGASRGREPEPGKEIFDLAAAGDADAGDEVVQPQNQQMQSAADDDGAVRGDGLDFLRFEKTELSQARFCHCTLRASAIRAERTLGSLRYAFGGDHPSQTTHQAVSLITKVRPPADEGWYFTLRLHKDWRP